MARRLIYARNKKPIGRWAVLVTIVVVALCGAAWKLFWYQPSGNNHNCNINAADTAGQDPVIITPPPTEDSQSSTINSRQNNHSQNDTTIPAATTRPKPEPPKLTVAEKLLDQGKAAFELGQYISAREKLTLAVESGLSDRKDRLAREYLNQAADRWLFSKNLFQNDTFCTRYKVKTGENLAKIAKKYDVPYELLMRINGIKDAAKLRAEQSIKILQGPFRVVVSRKRFLMTVYLRDIIARSYDVGLGMQGRDTPLGKWRIKPGAKQKNPEWTDPDTHKLYRPNDPDNPLGDRWIGLEGIEGQALNRVGFGIHGTIKPQEIGRAVSRGCIRLYNKDVGELFDMLIEKKTIISVVN